MRRRHFLMGLGLASTLPPRGAGAQSPQRVTLGVMGVRGRGRSLAEGFAGLPGVRVKYLCDVDPSSFPSVAAGVEKAQGAAPKLVADFRRILEDPEVQGLVVAAPDHWHALATMLACDAGKDVYVEKPCSHNVAEGLRMIRAARHTNRIVQVGTQRRSSADFQKAVEVLRSGRLGKLRLAKAINSQRRANIGKKGDGPVPQGVDYDLWLGPAPKRPFNPNRFHYNWHWFWDYGTGDLGNDGIHHVDVARWGLGVGAPKRVTSGGGKLSFDDDQETPDTQLATYEYDGCALVYEMRLWSPYGEHGFENGNVFYGEKGYMVLGDQGWQLYEPGGKLVETTRFSGRGDREHLENFVQCIRTRRRPACDIEEGQLSATLCHLGNIAHRTGRTVRFDSAAMAIRGDAEQERLMSRIYRDPWKLPKVG